MPEEGGSTQSAGMRCGQCGAEVVWDPGQARNLCPYCGHTLDPLESGDAVEEHELSAGLALESEEESSEATQQVRCQQCTAVSEWPASQTSGHCGFCGSPAMVPEEENSERIQPESLLPFTVDKKEARVAVQTWIKGLWFRPNDLKKVARQGRFAGLYVPYWTFDAQGEADYTAQRGDYYYVTVKRGDSTHRERRTRWTSVRGSVARAFDDVLVCASVGVPHEHIAGVEDWPTSALLPYNERYLSGFVAESYTVDLEDGWRDGRSIMEDHLQEDCVADIGGDTHRALNMNASFSERTFKHCLLPLWVGAYGYRGKRFQVLVNGTTATVDGSAPLSWIKIGLALISLASLGYLLWRTWG